MTNPIPLQTTAPGGLAGSPGARDRQGALSLRVDASIDGVNPLHPQLHTSVAARPTTSGVLDSALRQSETGIDLCEGTSPDVVGPLRPVPLPRRWLFAAGFFTRSLGTTHE